jgi:hypothetical protein
MGEKGLTKTAMVEYGVNDEGQFVFQVIQSCQIGQDKAECEAEGIEKTNEIRNGLASPKGVLVMPKVIEAPQVEVVKDMPIRRKKA